MRFDSLTEKKAEELKNVIRGSHAPFGGPRSVSKQALKWDQILEEFEYGNKRYYRLTPDAAWNLAQGLGGEFSRYFTDHASPYNVMRAWNASRNLRAGFTCCGLIQQKDRNTGKRGFNMNTHDLKTKTYRLTMEQS
jgi:hypothetical protein